MREDESLGLLAEDTGQKRLPCVFHRGGVSFPSPLGPHRVGLILEAEAELQGVWIGALWRQKPPGPWVLEGAPTSSWTVCERGGRGALRLGTGGEWAAGVGPGDLAT